MKKIILFIFTVTTLYSLSGQERIEQLYSMYGEHSIIREINRTKWMVYSDVDELSFSLVEDGNTNVDVIYLPDEFTSVSDFTIFEGTVFFCGMRNSVPVMGRFNLSSFPSTTIHYSEMTGVDTLTAIKTFDSDLYPESVPRHVLMIGRKRYTGILVDALSVFGNWDTYYITLYTKEDDTVLHDDIDTLNNYVVVASRKYPLLIEAPLTGTGYVWYLKKPNPMYAPILSPVGYFTIPDVSPFNAMKIDACEGNTCVAAALAYNSDSGIYTKGIHIYGFQYLYNIRTARIADGGIKYESLIDLCYDKATKTTELLLRYDDSQTIESRIFTLTQTTYPGISINWRSYAGHLINSLICQTHNSGWFIGSGIERNVYSGLNLYRYKNSGEPLCADYFSYEVEGTKNIPMLEGHETFEKITHPDITTSPREKRTIITTICPTKQH